MTATISLGVATHPENETVDDLIHQADLALYRSKALGRNRVSGTAPLTVVEPSGARRGGAGPGNPQRAGSGRRRRGRAPGSVTSASSSSSPRSPPRPASSSASCGRGSAPDPANPWTFVAFLTSRSASS